MFTDQLRLFGIWPSCRSRGCAEPSMTVGAGDCSNYIIMLGKQLHAGDMQTDRQSAIMKIENI